MTFAGVIGLIFVAGFALVLVIAGISLAERRTLTFWTTVSVPIWLITLLVWRPAYWPLESDNDWWGLLFIGVPLAVVTFVSVLIVVPAWLTRISTSIRERRSISQSVQEEA